MLIEHDGRRPDVHPSAYVAPTAVVSGDVTIGEDARILFGAVLTADVGPVIVGRQCIVMENALLRGRANHPARAEVRIHGAVQVNTHVPDEGLVPVGWVAVGDPARVLPPERHDEIWAVQEGLDFPRTVFGVERPAEGSLQALHPEITARYAELFGRHRDDRVLDGPAA